jgi:tetratricopeptide (TPR) repeat protein
MDLILSIRQMMADENYSGAEEALENLLVSSPASLRNELIPLYLETLLQQKKSLPDHLVTEALSDLWEKNPNTAINFFEAASDALKNSVDSRVLFFRMKLAEKRGRIQELHDLISSYHVRLFERSVPSVSPVVEEFVQKYFRADFQLQLQSLALTLLRKDLGHGERQIQKLILEAHEKSSPKILKEKLTALYNILHSQTEKGHLEIYESFVSLLAHGFREKKDYKRLAEVVIYFEDFRFGAMIMNLLLQNAQADLATEYSRELAQHEQYDFVYLAKHFPDLKKYFVNMTKSVSRTEEWETPDLSLTEKPAKSLTAAVPTAPNGDDELLIHLVRGQNFSDATLLDLAVGFLQSDLPRVALSVAMTVHDRVGDERMKLKAAYLALTALLQSGDYRKALDLALESMKLVSTTDDLLSFLYCEAEAWLRLNKKNEARQVLNKILSIDSDYRMTRERLEQLG